jgi:hypothetical protein
MITSQRRELLSRINGYYVTWTRLGLRPIAGMDAHRTSVFAALAQTPVSLRLLGARSSHWNMPPAAVQSARIVE